MAVVNTSSQFNTGSVGTSTGTTGTDVENYIQAKLLRLAQRHLVLYQFGEAKKLDRGRGITYTCSRYDRVPLPFAPLSEGVPPVGQTMILQQVQATAQQWGDKITITDVAQITIKHNLFQTAMKLAAMAMAETLERNTINSLLAGTQVNYVNKRGSRFALTAADVLNPTELQRVYSQLTTLGAPPFMGDERDDVKIELGRPSKASKSPEGRPHYVAAIHPFPAQDLRSNSTVANAWAQSDVNRLYNAEVGQWSGIHFCETNMLPAYTGYAQLSGTGGTAGSLATNTYYIIVTGSDTKNQFETYITQVSAGISVTGPTGSISVTTPNVSGFTWNVYVGTTTSPTNLGLCASGPTSGPLSGQATQLPSNTAVVITGTGVAQTPPAPVATGVTVYPTFIFGKDAYAQVVLDDQKFSYLDKADKSDPLNQLRMIGWKVMYGTLIQNNLFFARIESASGFSAAFG